MSAAVYPVSFSRLSEILPPCHPYYDFFLYPHFKQQEAPSLTPIPANSHPKPPAPGIPARVNIGADVPLKSRNATPSAPSVPARANIGADVPLRSDLSMKQSPAVSLPREHPVNVRIDTVNSAHSAPQQSPSAASPSAPTGEGPIAISDINKTSCSPTGEGPIAFLDKPDILLPACAKYIVLSSMCHACSDARFHP